MFDHDGLGRRVAVRRGALVRYEHRDEAGRLWSVTDAAGRALHTYVWLGDRIVARLDGAVGEPVAEAYLTDPLGTPNAVLIADGEGWRFERLRPAPYGSARDGARPTLYGHFGDAACGLVHFGARELDPELGLFITPDPWHGEADDPRRWAGAQAASVAREQPQAGSHAYALCRFDPLGRGDRDGHFSGWDILRWVLLPTWGFPLTSISLFFFEPLNLYMEVVGLIVWAFKGLFCEDKSHPWGNSTIVKSTWLLGSTRQFTFAFGLNGFLPRVAINLSSGSGANADRAVTIGNVIWINRAELAYLERPEVVELLDIAGGPAGAKFNDDPAKESAVVLICADSHGKQRLHVSLWSRGFGNAVVDRAGVQTFADVAAAGSAPGTLILRQPIPDGTPFPTAAKDKETIEVDEFTRAPGAASSDLEAASETWFALEVPSDTSFAKGQWLRVTAPSASGPKPDAAFREIRDVLPAEDNAALILSAELPARFQNAHLSTSLRIEQTDKAPGAADSAGWSFAPAPQAMLRRTVAAPAPDFPVDLTPDGIVKIVATTPAPAPALAGPAPGPVQDTSFAGIKELRVTLKLVPDAAGVAAASVLHRSAVDGASFQAKVPDIAALDSLKLQPPHPSVAKDDLLVVTRSGVADPVFVRAKAAPADEVLTIDPALPAAFAPAAGALVTLQRTKDTGKDDKAEVASVSGAEVAVKPPRGALFAAGNLVRLDVGGVPALRKIEAVTKMEIDIADPPVGTGTYTVALAKTVPGRVRKKVDLAPPGRFLKWKGTGTAPAALGAWPNQILAISFTGYTDLRKNVSLENSAFYVRWAGARPGSFHEDFHAVWAPAVVGADQYVVLEKPLPLVKRKDGSGAMKTWWRIDVGDYLGERDVLLDPLPAVPMPLVAIEFTASGARRTDAGGARVLAQQPELLVPADPSVHDTHRRALIEHETHHTVQCNFWGPIMGALPLSGVAMTVADFITAAGGDIPDWLKEVDRDANGQPPATADGRIDHNTEINPFQVVSIGGLMQLAWKYIILAPLRASGELASRIDDLDFDDFNKVFNPLSRLITDKLPPVDPQAPTGKRWLEFLGQLVARALDLRSWVPFTGFVPLLLPDGPKNFIEQGASRASGDLYSTILSANDRFNLKAEGRLFGKSTTSDADLHPGVGRIVRLLVFCGYRTDRVFLAGAGDRPGSPLRYRQLYAVHDLVTITLPTPGSTALFHDALYVVTRPTGLGAAPTVDIEGPPPAHTTARFVRANAGDTVFPKLRALVPLPPRVNRSMGWYLIPVTQGQLRLTSFVDSDAGTETALISVEDDVLLDQEPVAWAEPPAAGTAPTTRLVRFQTEAPTLRVRNHKELGSGNLEDVGIAPLTLDIADASVTQAAMTGNNGWQLQLSAAVPAAPVRMRIFRVIKKNDAGFDLAFKDVPTLAAAHSYLAGDVFVVIRDFLLEVQALPALGPQTRAYDDPLELALPIRLVAGERAITITPPAGLARPPVARAGDGPGRGERWKIGPLEQPPEEDGVFKVKVTYGRTGNSVDKDFDLTLQPQIRIAGAAGFEARKTAPLTLTITGGGEPYTLASEGMPSGSAAAVAGSTITVTVTTPPAADTKVVLKVSGGGKAGRRTVTVKTT